MIRVETEFNHGRPIAVPEGVHQHVIHGETFMRRVDVKYMADGFTGRNPTDHLYAVTEGNPLQGRRSELSGATENVYGVELLKSDEITLLLILTAEEIRRLYLKSLRPQEVLTLRERYGDFYEINEETYLPSGRGIFTLTDHELSELEARGINTEEQRDNPSQTRVTLANLHEHENAIRARIDSRAQGPILTQEETSILEKAAQISKRQESRTASVLPTETQKVPTRKYR